MPRTKARILVFPGSLRSGGHSAALASLAVQTLALADVEVTRISLADYPLPIYDADLEAEAGVPEPARRLHGLMAAHSGIFVATPEHNASVPPALVNALCWVSRVRPAGAAAASPWTGRVWAVGSTSGGPFGGLRAAMHLRQVLELGLGATVLPEEVTITHAAGAFAADGTLLDEVRAGELQRLLRRLADEAERLASL